jgi:hypothetical protein
LACCPQRVRENSGSGVPGGRVERVGELDAYPGNSAAAIAIPSVSVVAQYGEAAGTLPSHQLLRRAGATSLHCSS